MRERRRIGNRKRKKEDYGYGGRKRTKKGRLCRKEVEEGKK